MRLLEALILFSSLSFLAYGIAYFTFPNMKNEFKRFGLSKIGTLTAILEIAGALGLLAGLVFNYLLLLSAGGLALLMFLGVAVRLTVRDGLLAMMPALFFLGLNSYIFFVVLKTF
ncbi:MAG: DoxX family protein [Sphingobacteriaceae bacterium]